MRFVAVETIRFPYYKDEKTRNFRKVHIIKTVFSTYITYSRYFISNFHLRSIASTFVSISKFDTFYKCNLEEKQQIERIEFLK